MPQPPTAKTQKNNNKPSTSPWTDTYRHLLKDPPTNAANHIPSNKNKDQHITHTALLNIYNRKG